MAYSSDKFTGGTATASTEYAAEYVASKAVDDNGTTVWASSAVAPQWWKYDFGAGVAWAICKVTIDPRYFGGAECRAFTVNGSNDDSSWTEIYSGECANDDAKQTFTFANSTAYRYIKFIITSSYRSPQYVTIEEFEAMTGADVTIAAAITGAATIGSTLKREIPLRIAQQYDDSTIIYDSTTINYGGNASKSIVSANITKILSIASGIVATSVVGSSIKRNTKIASAVVGAATIGSAIKRNTKVASAIIGSAVVTSLARLNKRSYSDIISLATVSSTSRVQRIIQSAINAAAIVGSFVRVNLSFAGEVIANAVVTSAVKVQRNIQSAIQSDSTVTSKLVSTMRLVGNVVASTEITSALTQITPAISIASNVIANSIVSAGLRANYSLKAAIVSVANFSSLLTLLSGETTVGTFYLNNNTLIAKTGADTGTYHILDNATDIRVGGTYIPILPFHYPYFSSCTDGIVTLNLQIAA